MNFGLLLMRVTFGTIMFYSHGYSKIFGGKERWHELGGALTNIIGLDLFRTFFGLMASLSESLFALFIVFGLLTRISSFLLGFTMLVASFHHILDHEFPEVAILYLVFCVLILISGPGKHSLDHRLAALGGAIAYKKLRK